MFKTGGVSERERKREREGGGGGREKGWEIGEEKFKDIEENKGWVEMRLVVGFREMDRRDRKKKTV